MPSSKTTTNDEMHIPNPSKLILIRQDRLRVDDMKVFVRFGEQRIQVLDFSAFGIALFSVHELTPEVTQCAFEVENIEIAQIDLKKVRSEPYFHDGVNGHKTAFQILGHPLSVERVLAVKETNQLLNEHANLFKNDLVPEAFKLLTYELKNWLSQLESRVNEIEKSSFDEPGHKLDQYENVVTELVSAYIDQNIASLYKKVEHTIKELDPKTVKQCFHFFRNSVGGFMFQSSYASRAFNKPRGYAGDFEMMKTVYSSEIRGKTLFGKCMERYFVNVPEAQAVRNRGAFLSQRIRKLIDASSGGVKIMSMACGPAIEVQNLIREYPQLLTERVEFHFVDQDTDALKECQRAIADLSRQKEVRARFYFHNWAIKNVIESGLAIKDFDLIYSAGLFDYLSAPVAQYAGKQLVAALRAGGQAVIGNFDVSAPNRFGMTLVTDWNLIYRTKEDLIEIFAPIAKVVVEQEELGINLFAVLSK